MSKDYDTRKAVSMAIATSPHGVVEMVCVCNDGTMWRMQETGYWTNIRNVPQPIERDPADATTLVEPEYSEPQEQPAAQEPVHFEPKRGAFPERTRR